MSLPEAIQKIYEELAQRYEKQKDLRLRDTFLLLAADVAFGSGRAPEAERLHVRMLALSPNGLLRPYPTFARALESLDIQDYLADLRRQFPPDEAEQMLLRVRANPLGLPPERREPPSQRDTQEVVPAMARTVDLAPRPSEPFHVPLPPSNRLDLGSKLSTLWVVVALAAGLGLALWTLVRPFWHAR